MWVISRAIAGLYTADYRLMKYIQYPVGAGSPIISGLNQQSQKPAPTNGKYKCNSIKRDKFMIIVRPCAAISKLLINHDAAEFLS